MIILALDIATTTGWAYGPAGDPRPKSGSVRLKRPADPQELAPANLFMFLRDRMEEWRLFGGPPEMVFLEHFLNPVAQPSADAAILQLMSHGAVQAFFADRDIPVRCEMPATIRRHFIGTARAPKGTKAGEIKRLVAQRCVQLGYVHRTCTDYDQTDALAAWDYASAVYGRVIPSKLAMFGGAS